MHLAMHPDLCPMCIAVVDMPGSYTASLKAALMPSVASAMVISGCPGDHRHYARQKN